MDELRNSIIEILKNTPKGIEEFGCPCDNCTETRNKIADKILALLPTTKSTKGDYLKKYGELVHKGEI